ncbi:hypothetical protein [Novosphingobium sp. 9]|uniref:hypothetical protein n=1 Tax=Novosphingobium sp. 9 TaxID=2025349 RepID=UPI0021B59337|nr:hypothetical protein [Novosphingobium sp. 9]
MTDEIETTPESARKPGTSPSETPQPAAPQVVHHTTIVRERSGSGMGVVLAVILLVAAIAAIYVFNQQSTSEVAKNDAVTQAANKIGNAAADVGEAAKQAADTVTDKSSGNP